MKVIFLLPFWFAVLSLSLRAHVVNQLYGEWSETPDGWGMEVQFEAGYAVPEIRNDPLAAAPDRDWLIAQGPAGWETLRKEAEDYLRKCLRVEAKDQWVDWTVEFTDFANQPPDFLKLLTNGAYLRMKIRPIDPPGGPVVLRWLEGEDRPTFVLKIDAVDGGYLSLEPGDSRVVNLPEVKLSGALWMSFRQGFLHVVPMGWDHVLFVMGLFFYRRKWRPLLSQSLAFTAAHTVTLGLAAGGMVNISGNWVEPVIALSLVAVALENLRAEREADGRVRLLIVFGFGLIHGLGFAGALSAWLKPGEGFLPSLGAANIGVEAAQAALLGTAWILTIGWNQTRVYRVVRLIACLGIAAIGGFWAFQRMG